MNSYLEETSDTSPSAFEHVLLSECEFVYHSKAELNATINTGNLKSAMQKICKNSSIVDKENTCPVIGISLSSAATSVFTPSIIRPLFDTLSQNLAERGEPNASPEELKRFFQGMFYCMAYNCSIGFLYRNLQDLDVVKQMPKARMEALFAALDTCPNAEIITPDGDENFLYEEYDGASSFGKLEREFAESMSRVFFREHTTVLTFDDHQITGKGKSVKERKIHRRNCKKKASIFGMVFEIIVMTNFGAILAMRLRRLSERPRDAFTAMMAMLSKVPHPRNPVNIDRDYFWLDAFIELSYSISATCMPYGMPFTTNRENATFSETSFSNIPIPPGNRPNNSNKRYVLEQGALAVYKAWHKTQKDAYVVAYRTGRVKTPVVYMARKCVDDARRLSFFGEPQTAAADPVCEYLRRRVRSRGVGPSNNAGSVSSSSSSNESERSVVIHGDPENSDEETRPLSKNLESNAFRSLLYRMCENYDVLTTSQRSADWFLLRIGRVTGKGASSLKTLADRISRGEQVSQTEGLEFLLKSSWYLPSIGSSTAKWANRVREGCLYENSIVSAAIARLLGSGNAVRAVLTEPPLLGVKGRNWMAVSADGLLLLDETVASVEAKLCTSEATRKKCYEAAQGIPDPHKIVRIAFEDSEEMSKYVFQEDKMQVLHQATVLDVDVVYYVRSNKADIYYIAAVEFNANVKEEHRQMMERMYNSFIRPVVDPTEPVPQLSTFPKGVDQYTFEMHVRLNRCLTSYVLQNGPEPPLNAIKPVESFVVNKQKAGVDKFTQCAKDIMVSERALTNPGQRLIFNMLAALIINTRVLFAVKKFCDQRRHLQSDLMKNWRLFVRNPSQVPSLRNFTIDLASDADVMWNLVCSALCRDRSIPSSIADVSSPERRILARDARACSTNEMARKKRRVAKTPVRRRTASFWDSEDGMQLRASGAHVPISIGYSSNCIICTTYRYVNQKKSPGLRSRDRFKTRESTNFKCNNCEVPLCTKIRPPNRLSCFELFHKRVSVKKLKERRDAVENLIAIGDLNS